MPEGTQIDTASDSPVCRILRRSGYVLLAAGLVIGLWAVLVGAKSERPIPPLALAVLPLVLMFLALRLADNVLLCSITTATTALLIFGAAYLYLDAFLVHHSSLNSILLLQIPLLQGAAIMPELVLIVLKRRSGRRPSCEIGRASCRERV